MDYKDYYKVLGVSRNANEKEIKTAFRKLAQQYHPDKNQGDDKAEQKFKEVNEAYTVLSDADKRSHYDRFGSQWDKFNQTGGNPGDFWSQWSGANGGGARQTMSPEDLESMFGNLGGMNGGAGGAGFSTFFDSLFNGGMGGAPGMGNRGQGARPRVQQPQQTAVPVSITLEEAFSGTTRTLDSNTGDRFEVTIPPGVKSGSKVRVRNPNTKDVFMLKVTLLKHEEFRREGDNLHITAPLDFYTAVLGGELQVSTMERDVVLTIPPGTQGSKTFRLRGQGMPNLKVPSQRGDLLVELDIVVPTDLSTEEKELFEKLREARQ